VANNGNVLGEEAILTQHAEWIKVSIIDTLQRVICCATNRVFVGVPLCL
jgi:hypothetical protein